MNLESGAYVTPSLRLVRMVGRGAMGSVWVADHLTLQTHVAIKFMSATVSDDPVSVKRFAREARAAAQIKSPHVVQIFDHGVTDDGIPYIVMELLEGESLEKRFRRTGPLNVVEVAQIVSQACKALAKAHEIGIVHRDIKPANLFLCESGSDLFVKVLDFGVAKFSGDQAVDMTTPGHMVGTPSYMSPEQYFDAKSVSHRSDLWSLGIVTYVLLTGKRPFEGATIGELVVAIKAAQPDPPSAIRRDLPPTIDEWMARALAPDPTHRFASAKEMAQTLERAVGLASIMGSSPSLVGAPTDQVATFSGSTSASNALLAASSTAVAPPYRRSGVVVVGAVVALVLAAGIGAGALLVSGRGDRSGERPSTASSDVETTPTEPQATNDAATDPSATEPSSTPASVDAGPAAVESADAADAAVPEADAASSSPAPRGPGPAAPPQDERMQRAKDRLGI